MIFTDNQPHFFEKVPRGLLESKSPLTFFVCRKCFDEFNVILNSLKTINSSKVKIIIFPSDSQSHFFSKTTGWFYFMKVPIKNSFHIEWYWLILAFLLFFALENGLDKKCQIVLFVLIVLYL